MEKKRIDLEAQEISPEQIEFAKAVADLADKYEVEHIELQIKPYFYQRLNGEISIHISKTDGRGRPCRNIRANYTTNVSFDIEKNAPSSS